MNIYIDFDDCLCETARFFSKFAKRLFDIEVPYEAVRSFNLQESFRLSDEQYKKMMLEGHLPEQLLSLEETPDASDVVNGWIDRGHHVSIITGRPASVYESSRRWLDEHGLERAELFCLNKYGRTLLKESTFNLELEDYRAMHFDFAVEDSPMAFQYFTHLPDLKVCVFDRPWNREHALPGKNYSRCGSWEQINHEFKKQVAF